MRTLFVIIGLLGLFLIGLGAFEIREVRNFDAGVRDVQQLLIRLDEEAVAKAKSRGGGYLITSLADDFGSRLNGFSSLERGWLVVTSSGGALLILGVTGIILEKRIYFKKSLSDESSKPTAIDA